MPSIGQTDEWSAMAASLIDCRGEQIIATGLACFMIDQLEKKTYIRQTPFVADV